VRVVALGHERAGGYWRVHGGGERVRNGSAQQSD
jgi:hypothetical protein